MKFNASILHSRVAQRILILFMLASLLPAGASILLSLGYTHHINQSESDKQLYQASKSYGLSIFERIDLLSATLRETAAFIDASRKNGNSYTPGNSLSSMAQGIVILKQNGDIIPILNTVRQPPKPDKAQYRHLADGKPVVSSRSLSNAPAELFITVPIRPGGDLLIARVNNRFIWGEPSTFPYQIDYSVFDNGNRLLFSSYPDPGIVRTKLDEPHNKSEQAILKWSADDQNFQGSVRDLFLGANFGTSNWHVVAITPIKASGTSLDIFQMILVPTVLLSALLVSLFSISQIRRTLFPLEKLMGYIKHISNREFRHRLDFSTGDEFDELAMAFNNMSNRLAKQFEAMTILSEIDQSILASPDFRRVQTMVLKNMSKIIPAQIISIGIFEKHRPDLIQICTLDTSSGYFEDSKSSLPYRARKQLLARPDGLISDKIDDYNRSIFEFRQNHPITHAVALPIIIDNQLTGILGVGLDHEFNDPDDIDLKVCRDIADRLAVTLSTMELDNKLFQRLNYDELTGLPNRQNLIKDIDRYIVQARAGNRSLTIMYIDLDRFKNINDAYGHNTGDQILKQAATRIASCIDGTYILSRLNADEFTIVLPDLQDVMDIGSVADRIIHSLTEPFVAGHVENYLGASIGIAIYPHDAENPLDLLMRADTAMAYAKETGRNKYAFFSEEMNRRVDEQMMLERELRQALDLGELDIHYQPKVNLSSGLVEGAEALIRWNHPTKGQIKPDVFIPLAEDIGIINRLGEWVLNTVCTQFQSWRASGINIPTVSVNVSTYQFRQNDFTDRISQAIDRSGIDPAALELEVTESLIMENVEQAIEILDYLSSMGIQIAIDDFGTGYSSMSYLKNLPFDSLKIDRSFIKDLPGDRDSAAITRSVIAMAQALNKTIIAEGAESEEQISFLRSHHCTYVQGYYFSPPLPADQFLSYVNGINKNAVA